MSDDIVARLRAVEATGGIHWALSGNAADEIERLRAELAAANARVGWFEEHMRMIARIENKLTGGDWDEIEEARWIAWRALDRNAFLKGSRND